MHRTGQILTIVGLYLPQPVFAHGQLYVALFRVNSKEDIKILLAHLNKDESKEKTEILFTGKFFKMSNEDKRYYFYL